MGQLAVEAIRRKPGQLADAVSMTHPDFQHAMALGRGEVGYSVKQARVPSGTYFGRPKLSMVAGLNLSAKLQSHGLHAVANTKHRKPALKDKFGGLIGMVVIGACMTAREHNALDRRFFQIKA